MNREAVLEVLTLAHYAEIADEYYDVARHPTCAN